MHAASLLDGFSFDLFPPFENSLAAPGVDVSRRQVVQALVVSTVVVVPDELLDALFELSWQVVVVQQDPYERNTKLPFVSVKLTASSRGDRSGSSRARLMIAVSISSGILFQIRRGLGLPSTRASIPPSWYRLYQS